MNKSAAVVWIAGGIGLVLVLAAYHNVSVGDILKGNFGDSATAAGPQGASTLGKQLGLDKAGEAAGKAAGKQKYNQAVSGGNDYLNSSQFQKDIANSIKQTQVGSVGVPR